MPPSLSASDLALRSVWQVSLALAVVSLVTALVLVVKRWSAGRRLEKDAVRRAALSAEVYALLASPRAPRPDSLSLRPGDAPHILAIALDVLRVTRGRDAERMVEIVEFAGIHAYLEKGLRSRSRSLRIRVISLLSHFEDQRSLNLLRSRIADRGLYVQLAALRALADRRDYEALPETVRVLGKARETNVPLLADILRRFGEPAVPTLAALALSEASQGVKLAAVSALGGIASLTAFGPLSDLAAEPDPVLRAAAVNALGRLGDPRAVAEIGWGLEAAEDRVRVQAAIAAGLIGSLQMAPALVERLEDPVWEVRYRAAEALYRLGGAGLALLSAAAKGEGLGGEMARELLAEKGGVLS
jgi:hypothetical protein